MIPRNTKKTPPSLLTQLLHLQAVIDVQATKTTAAHAVLVGESAKLAALVENAKDLAKQAVQAARESGG